MLPWSFFNSGSRVVFGFISPQVALGAACGFFIAVVELALG
ncbi:hypothetical protein MuYL_1501 [Mucilaginibacter xinganensis]|uniref:Uncharacterized protein n=1 Tax=Mucilaginibacter xinganensis TaxID=1234841 RepID=A0A223NU25_9SPHI|nr:hypothetical protein MuYL_1501 [Mucilaginibacter xinganensis]